MTSGQFTNFPIDQIWVDRAKRQRRDLPDIPSLAESIGRSGLINPPVIRRSGELVAGERRWTACKSLGWTALPVQFVEDLSELELHIIEFEENVRRVDLPWQDQCTAVEQYHKLKAKQDPDWTARKTAQALGLSDS
jgi:ParB family chromosome partitioning protein